MQVVSIAAVRFAFRRSRLREGAVLALEVLGEGSVRDVAIALGADARHVVGALVGSYGKYRREESLVTLGLVQRRWVGERALFSLTERGRELAAQLRRSRSAYST